MMFVTMKEAYDILKTWEVSRDDTCAQLDIFHDLLGLKRNE